jgi:hypothetical protein
MWPAPTGQDYESVMAALESLRTMGMAMSAWSDNESDPAALRARIRLGLMAAGTAREGADAVARDIVRLIEVIQGHAVEIAAAAKLAGDKMEHLYAEPVREWQRNRLTKIGTGLALSGAYHE